MKKIVSFLLLAFLVSNCSFRKDDLVGTYISKNNLNTVNTLQFLGDGTYINVIYRKVDNTLVCRNTGKWAIADTEGSIICDNFLRDDDHVYAKEPSDYKYALISTRLLVENSGGEIKIHHMIDDDKYFEKIK